MGRKGRGRREREIDGKRTEALLHCTISMFVVSQLQCLLINLVALHFILHHQGVLPSLEALVF